MPTESDSDGGGGGGKGGFSRIYFQLRHEQKLMIRCEIFRLIGKQSREIDCLACLETLVKHSQSVMKYYIHEGIGGSQHLITNFPVLVCNSMIGEET